MDSSSKKEVDHEVLPFLRVYKDGQVERLGGTEFVSASLDSHATVSSKDVIINPETGLSARLYITKRINKGDKLPLLIYFHGGCFLVQSPFSPTYHNYLNSLVEEANIVAMSVNYRLAPEYPLPTAYEDSWETIQWVDTYHDSWLSDYVDYNRVFMSGDSAGANIIHNMAMRAGDVKLQNGLKFVGVVLVHPFFWGSETIGSEEFYPDQKAIIDRVCKYIYQSSTGQEDPRINPIANGAPSLQNTACSRVLIFVAGEDVLKDRGFLYYEVLKNSGWKGVVEIAETEGEGHGFHLLSPACDKAVIMMKSVVSFLNQHNTPT